MDNKWNAPLFPSNDDDRPAQTTATHSVPDEIYRKLTQSLDQIRGLCNKLQNNQENETKKMSQRINNIEKELETNKEDTAQTKELITTVRAGVENLQISVPKLEERVATVENTNTTIIQLLEKAEKCAEKDKEDIQRWCTRRSSVPNEIVAIPPAVSPNATTTSQLSGSTRKIYLRRFLG